MDQGTSVARSKALCVLIDRLHSLRMHRGLCGLRFAIPFYCYVMLLVGKQLEHYGFEQFAENSVYKWITNRAVFGGSGPGVHAATCK